MSENDLKEIIAGMKEGRIIPYLGAGALAGVVSRTSGRKIPADSESLILAINDGKPMAPKLMYEFPRAAMNLELKKGRSYIERTLTEVYAGHEWSDSPVHQFLASLHLPYIIDTNRDDQLQRAYRDRRHNLVVGVARIAGSDYRFNLYEFTGENYESRVLDQIDPNLPTLFKPMGTPLPHPNFIASDADYVDYITELMGGFAVPAFIKDKRVGKQYVVLGLRLTRDTERMVLTDLIYGAQQMAGWIFLPDGTPKEERFCAKHGLAIVRATPEDLVNETKQAAE